MKPLVSIVVLSYNNLEHTISCLESIKKNTSVSYELIVIDNGSIDGTSEYLKNCENAKIILNISNKGIACQYNKGMSASSTDYILLLDSNTVVTENWLSNLLSCAQSSDSIGIVGPMTNSGASLQRVPSSYSNLNEMHEFAKYFNKKDNGKYTPINSLDGFCLLVKREVLDTIGMFDEVYTGGGLEFADYCLRAQFKGYEIYCAGDTFIHRCLDNITSSNKIDYLDVYQNNRDHFVEKWKKYIPFRYDLIQKIISLVTHNMNSILYVGDMPIIPATLKRKGHSVHSIRRSQGYSFLDILDEERYNAVIIWDNITHENSFVNTLQSIENIITKDGLLIANITNAFYYSRLEDILSGNLTISSFVKEIPFPLACISKPEIIAWTEMTGLFLKELIGFATHMPSSATKFINKLCKASDNYHFIKEECNVQEYLAVWKKSNRREQ